MRIGRLLALLALASPVFVDGAARNIGAFAQSLPTPNLGTGTKLNGVTITTTATKGQGTSVADPGTGNLEMLLPVQTVTGASKTFASSDLFKETRRSNSGAAMSDTFPASSATGMVNGARMFVNNVDASANLTITAGSGTTINGTSFVVLGAGRSSYWVYDAPNTVWRPTGNSLTSLLSANNLSDIANAAAARTNLGLGTAATVNTGTSGATIPLNNANNTFGGSNTFAGGQQVFQADSVFGNQMLVKGSTNANQQLYFGYSTSSDYGTMQAILQGTGYKPLYLQPSGGLVGIGTTNAAGNIGELALSKQAASGLAPGVGNLKIGVVAGTNTGTCKIIAYAGTSTTPVTIVDNVGGGC